MFFVEFLPGASHQCIYFVQLFSQIFFLICMCYGHWSQNGTRRVRDFKGRKKEKDCLKSGKQ